MGLCPDDNATITVDRNELPNADAGVDGFIDCVTTAVDLGGGDEFVGVAGKEAGEGDEGDGGVVVAFDGAEDGDRLTGGDVLAFEEQAVAVTDRALQGEKVVDVGG